MNYNEGSFQQSRSLFGLFFYLRFIDESFVDESTYGLWIINTGKNAEYIK